MTSIEIGRSVDKLIWDCFYELESGTKDFKVFRGHKNQNYLVKDMGDTYIIIDSYQREDESNNSAELGQIDG